LKFLKADDMMKMDKTWEQGPANVFMSWMQPKRQLCSVKAPCEAPRKLSWHLIFMGSDWVDLKIIVVPFGLEVSIYIVIHLIISFS
jgi:hypothetical protein